MLTFKLCATARVGFVWLKEIAEETVFPIVTLMIPQEVRSVEQTVIEAPPAELAVVNEMTAPEIFVDTAPLFWLELLSTE